MVLAEKELWEVVVDRKVPAFSFMDPKVRIAYNRREKAFAILVLNLSDSQLSHIRLCKTSTEAWAKLCKIHKAKI